MYDPNEIRERFDALTNREREIAEMVYDGMTTAEIASALDITQRTVGTHRHRIMSKMQAKNIVLLARMLSTLEEPCPS